MIDRAFRPDPRAKLALLLLWAVAVFLSPGLWFEALLMLLSVALGIALGKGRLALGMLGLYAVMMACMLATAQLDTGVLKMMLSSFFMLVRKVFPCGLLAAVIVSTTHVNEFMSAFSRMRVPRQVTIPLAVMLRYVPAIREDWRFISDAMRMRGVNASLAGFLRRPGMTVECLYVPLMMSASNVADELSMASVARGIENPAQRTCYTHIEFRASDGLLVAAGVALYKNWDKVKAKAGELWDGIKTVFGGIKDSIVGAFNSAKEAVGSFFSWIGDKLSALDGAIESVPVIGSIYRGIKGAGSWVIDKVTGHATGTSYFPGGWTRVNERGGEIMRLPGGTQIIPHDVSRRMAGGTMVQVYVTVQGKVIGNQAYAESLGETIAQKLLRALRNS